MAELNGASPGGLRDLLRKHAPQGLKRLYRSLRGIEDQEAMWDRIAAMRKRYHRGNPVRPAAKPKKVLFNSQFGWPYGIVEYTLAAALRERGHDVTMFACGGLPKYCELMTSTQDRPPCGECHASVARRFDAFGLPHGAMKDYLTDADRREAVHIAENAEIGQLRHLVEDGVPVGQLAFFNLFQYFKGFPFDLSGKVGEVFRDCVSSAILTSRAAGRMLDKLQPDILCTANGKFLQWSPFIYHAVKRNIQYVTWEDYQISPAGVVFAVNDIAHETRHTAVWQKLLDTPLTPDELSALREHFSLWSKGEVTPWAGYAAGGANNDQEIRAELGLRAGVPVIVLFPNLSWDASSVGFETAFTSMYDWLYQAVDYAASHPDVELVIRAHPAEARLPDHFKPPVPVCEAIRKQFADVPRNVHLIEGSATVNSYALASLANVAMVYTSTLGIELPLRGIKPWVAAGPYYAGKGFTVDIQSGEHMRALLDAGTFQNRLAPEEIARAERMAYLIRFRGIFEFPLMPKAGEFGATSWADIGPEGNATLDALCERLIEHEPFIDLPPAGGVTHQGSETGTH